MTPTAEITPFQIDIPQSALDDLHDRLTRTRWPSQIAGLGWSRGVEQSYLQELVEYWQHRYDWRAQEAELNNIPQFTTGIDGANIHFLHIRSAHADATPLILTHGWPGSIVEFLAVIGPLTDPVAYGGEAGWDSYRIATAFAELMSQLGYDRYLAQGGDFGAFIAPDLGRVAADHVIGVHVNAATMGFVPFGELDEDTMAGLTDTEKARVARLGAYMSDGNGYFQIQATRPNTLGFALTDSPVGQLAWIVEKFKEWSHPSSELPEQSIDRDRMLTNVMIYWLTRTGASSAQLYYESMHSGRWPTPSSVPTGVAAFAEDVSIRRFSEPGNNIVHWTDFNEGGHFAALEKPGLLVADLRRFRNALR